MTKSWWHRLVQKTGLAKPPGQSPVHAALVSAARQVAQQATPIALGDQAIEAESIVVFDLETSGLNTNEDAVLEIGAVTITGGAIALGPVFERVLAAPADMDSESQLIHGLTQKDLAAGSPPRSTLLDFLEYSTNRIWMAYHAEFDRAMLQRAVKDWLGVEFDPYPLDVAVLAPTLFPDKGGANCPLDHWLEAFGLQASVRHNALADAMVTAELVLILLDRAQKLGYETWADLNTVCQQWQQVQRHLPSV